jgi:multiple sugar transport system ATP-binding protein
MAVMRLDRLNKIYPNGVQAVYDFNATFQDGEFIVLVGPSGCGKSTMLRMIAGLEEISSGELSIDGVKINDLAPKDRDIAMVFQNYALYAHMTVYHNMAFSMVLRREDSDLIHERVMWAASVLGLTPYLNRKPNTLSGGQRQRVALGRAIVRNPKVFLLDEPLSNLDAKLRGVMRAELKSLHHRLKTTMVYVTHDQIEALTLADRIVIMKDGRVQQIGTPYEVYHTPANLYVATFMGTPPMNVFQGALTQEGKLAIAGATIDIAAHPFYETLRSQGRFGANVTVGVRPEHVRMDVTCDTTRGHQSVVDLYELLGAEALVHFKVGAETLIAKVPEHLPLRAHGEVCYAFDVEHIHFFDPSTGVRIHA